MSRILIVDDDDQVRKMLRRKLERSGYEAIEAINGRMALDLHQANPADLIIMDLIMPEKEGIETIIELRRNFPTVKIIAISGGSRRLEPENSLNLAKFLGAEYTLKKPFQLNKLITAIQSLLPDDKKSNQ